MNEPADESEILRRLEIENEAIAAAIGDAVREALWRHKRLGQYVVGWRDGQVVRIPPEEIPVDEPPPPFHLGSYR